MSADAGIQFAELGGECFVIRHQLAEANEARIITKLICTALGLFKTVAAMSAPCSEKAHGRVRRPPRADFAIADCDSKRANSAALS